jgi:hypothetical protein
MAPWNTDLMGAAKVGQLVAKIGSCLFILIVFAASCHWGARAYFAAVLYLNNIVHGRFLRTLMLYVCGTAFAAIEIPTGTFGPLWLCEELHLISGGQIARSILILLGAVALAISVWAAFRSEDGRRFSKTLRSVNDQQNV